MKSLTAYSTVLCIKEVITIRRKITFISYYISIYITCLPFFMHVLGKFSGYGSSFIQVSQERATESSTMEWVESSFLSLQSYGMAIQKSPSLHTWDYYCLPLLFFYLACLLLLTRRSIWWRWKGKLYLYSTSWVDVLSRDGDVRWQWQRILFFGIKQNQQLHLFFSLSRSLLYFSQLRYFIFSQCDNNKKKCVYFLYLVYLTSLMCFLFLGNVWRYISLAKEPWRKKGNNCNIIFFVEGKHKYKLWNKWSLGPLLWIEWRHVCLCGILCFSFIFIMFILCLLLFSLRSSCLHFFAFTSCFFCLQQHCSSVCYCCCVVFSSWYLLSVTVTRSLLVVVLM